MHRPAITTIILLAFTASAVLGLCAMVGDGMMHNGLCAGTGMNAVLCAANPLRVVSLLILLATVVSFFAVFAVWPRPVQISIGVPTHVRSRVVLQWSPLAGLQALFSDGLLNPKVF